MRGALQDLLQTKAHKPQSVSAYMNIVSRYGSVSKVTDYELDDWGSIVALAGIVIFAAVIWGHIRRISGGLVSVEHEAFASTVFQG